jgi:hypothetical protein
VVAVHNGRQTGRSQFVSPAASNAYSLSSSEPTKTVPLATLAEVWIDPPTRSLHDSASVGTLPVPIDVSPVLSPVCAAPNRNIGQSHELSSIDIAPNTTTTRNHRGIAASRSDDGVPAPSEYVSKEIATVRGRQSRSRGRFMGKA